MKVKMLKHSMERWCQESEVELLKSAGWRLESEPAKEVFCKYKITNEPINKAIISTEDGYSINLPQKITFDSFSKEFQIAAAMQLGTSEKLLDVKDGGNESLEFRQYNKIQSEDRNFNVIHFVEIKPIEILYQTMS